MDNRALLEQALDRVTGMAAVTGQLMDPVERWQETAFLASRNGTGLFFESIPLFFLDQKTTETCLDHVLPKAIRRLEAWVVVISFSLFDPKAGVEFLNLTGLAPGCRQDRRARVERSGGLPEFVDWREVEAQLATSLTGQVQIALDQVSRLR